MAQYKVSNLHNLNPSCTIYVIIFISFKQLFCFTIRFFPIFPIIISFISLQCCISIILFGLFSQIFNSGSIVFSIVFRIWIFIIVFSFCEVVFCGSVILIFVKNNSLNICISLLGFLKELWGFLMVITSVADPDTVAVFLSHWIRILSPQIYCPRYIILSRIHFLYLVLSVTREAYLSRIQIRIKRFKTGSTDPDTVKMKSDSQHWLL